MRISVDLESETSAYKKETTISLMIFESRTPHNGIKAMQQELSLEGL
jgi:hypothetical protein